MRARMPMQEKQRRSRPSITHPQLGIADTNPLKREIREHRAC
jgi:hypothetical protein